MSKSLAVDATDAEHAVFRVLAEVAASLSCEAHSVALAWVIARGWVPVVGPRSVEQLAGNLAGVGVELQAEQLIELNDVSARPLGYPYELLEKVRNSSGLGRALFARSGSVL